MKFLVLDGNSIFSRAFYGIKMLSNKNGQMTNGIYGFLTTLNKLLNEINPDRVAIAFDLKIPTFRHKMYDGYKASRQKPPEEMISQLPILKDLLIAMGYKIITCEGFEADDILGTFANFCEKNNFECVLATGDKDILQLISDKVSVMIASTKFGKSESTLYNTEKVLEEYGVSAKSLVDMKALQGDTSDNIPGVYKIGKKTAQALIMEFGSIENIYNNLENLGIKQSLKDRLYDGKESAFLSYKLGKIVKNIPININEQDYKPKNMDAQCVKKMLTDLEFFSLLEKLDLKNEKQTIKFEKILPKEALSIFSDCKFLSFFCQIENSEIKNIFLSTNEIVYMIENNNKDFLDFIKNIFENKNIEKISYDFKALYKCIEKLDIEISGKIFDVMLAAYLSMPSEKDYDILKLANIYNIEDIEITSAHSFEKFAKKTYIVNKLKNILEKNIKENNQFELLTNIEQPLSKVLANMENIGFLVDKEGIETYGKEIEKEIETIKNSIYELSGEEFNINSPKQLGYILFEKLGLPHGKKSKTGYCTSADILEKLSEKYEIVNKILNYRSISKLKSTYCDGLIKLISPSGRIHSTFNQTETRTGRISSSEPNLQNIPIRTQKGKVFRKFFIAKPDHVLIDADYSQIELRVLAHISQDENMIKAFKNNEDIHASTAAQIMGIPIENVTSEMRFKAKAVNFGIIYGMSAFSLSKDLEISLSEAQIYISKYFSHYEKIQAYMENTINQAKERGFVETIFSRRRYLPEINSSNFILKNFAQRVARNMPIQGTAADIIKIAMINVFEKLKSTSSKLILQVHDELIIESPVFESEKIKNMLKSEMKNATKLLVPLSVNISIGKTWYDAKD